LGHFRAVNTVVRRQLISYAKTLGLLALLFRHRCVRNPTDGVGTAGSQLRLLWHLYVGKPRAAGLDGGNTFSPQRLNGDCKRKRKTHLIRLYCKAAWHERKISERRMGSHQLRWHRLAA